MEVELSLLSMPAHSLTIASRALETVLITWVVAWLSTNLLGDPKQARGFSLHYPFMQGEIETKLQQ